MVDCAANEDAHVLGTCTLVNVPDGKAAHATDRVAVIKSVTSDLRTRFAKVLDHPVLQAMAIFEHRNWPASSDTTLTPTFGDIEISRLF